MSNTNQDTLLFRYSGFLQNVEIQITPQSTATGYKVSCSARLKLPILKKNFTTWTVFSDDTLEWLSHSPVCEEGAEERTVEKNKFSLDAVDPVGFFLKIERGDWTSDKVHLVIGAKEVVLDVKQGNNEIEVSRPEKNQKLIIKIKNKKIDALEVPVPVIGNLCIKRVL